MLEIPKVSFQKNISGSLKYLFNNEMIDFIVFGLLFQKVSRQRGDRAHAVGKKTKLQAA